MIVFDHVTRLHWVWWDRCSCDPTAIQRSIIRRNTWLYTKHVGLAVVGPSYLLIPRVCFPLCRIKFFLTPVTRTHVHTWTSYTNSTIQYRIHHSIVMRLYIYTPTHTFVPSDPSAGKNMWTYTCTYTHRRKHNTRIQLYWHMHNPYIYIQPRLSWSKLEI